MSYVDIIILRHLLKRPAHGYDLRKRVSVTTGYTLHNNALYPALKRFEEAGAVTRAAEAQEGRPPRNVYTITDTGREMLHDMLTDLPDEQAGDETEVLSRIGQFDLITPEERRRVLAKRDAAVVAQIERVRGLRDQAVELRWGTMIANELIRRFEAERVWLAELMAEADG